MREWVKVTTAQHPRSKYISFWTPLFNFSIHVYSAPSGYFLNLSLTPYPKRGGRE